MFWEEEANAEGRPPGAAKGGRLRWSADDRDTTVLVLGVKALLFLFAALALGTLFDRYDGMMEMWNRWDAVHYLSLAKDGYVGEGEARFSIVFYPLYPWMVRVFSLFTQSYFTAALAVSGAASLGAALLLRRLTAIDHPAAVARQAVWFFLIFPTSYFLHIGYTESLFLVLVLGSLLAARTDHWAAAGLLGALACLTRVNGLMLGPTLLMEAWLQYRAARRIDWRWLWMGAVPLGFLAYLALNYRVTGDPFAFSPIMEEHWFKTFTPPWVGIYDVWLRTPGINLTEGLLELLFIILGLVGVIWCWLRLSPTYGVWMSLNWLLMNSTSFVVSVPRYTLTLFPLFILFARLGHKRPVAGLLLSVISLFLLALYTMKFAYGTWAF